MIDCHVIRGNSNTTIKICIVKIKKIKHNNNAKFSKLSSITLVLYCVYSNSTSTTCTKYKGLGMLATLSQTYSSQYFGSCSKVLLELPIQYIVVSSIIVTNSLQNSKWKQSVIQFFPLHHT